MKNPNSSRLFVAPLLAVILLAACASPITDGNLDAQIATSVSATLQAQGGSALPAATDATPDGEVLQQGAYADCANTGQLTLAYLAYGNVWLWVEGGAKTQLTNTGDAGSVRVSSDGCRIAYARAVPNPAYDPNAEFSVGPTLDELWVIRSDGAGNQKLAGTEFYSTLPAPQADTSYSLYQFEWQPGSHRIAFSTRLEFAGPGLEPINDIHLIDADNLALSSVAGPGQGGWFTFSHNGSQLAFSTPTSINLINADGSNARLNLVTFPDVITYSEYQYSPPIYWRSDDSALMAAIPPHEGLAGPVNGVFPQTAIWQVPVDGNPGVQIASVQGVWFAMQPVKFSPDGSRIGYMRPLDPNNNQRELVISNSDGSSESAPIQLTEVFFEAWAQDSNQFIYSFRDPAFHLFLGSADSPNVQPISTLTAFDAVTADITWSKGSTFVLRLNGNFGTELSVMDVSGNGTLVESFPDYFTQFDVAD